MAAVEKALCTECGSRFEAKPRVSLLGFRRFRCPDCNAELLYPLVDNRELLYWLAPVGFLVLLLTNPEGAQKYLPLTGEGLIRTLTLAALFGSGWIALAKNASIKKTIASAGKADHDRPEPGQTTTAGTDSPPSVPETKPRSRQAVSAPAREDPQPPQWVPPPKRMPDGSLCNHEGEAANYCTRCWAYLKPYDR